MPKPAPAATRPAYHVTVATVDEVPPGGVRIVSVDDRSIGIFNVDGTYYALANKCPHAGSPVCRGMVTGMSVADRPSPDVGWTDEGRILRCPWHGWEFEIPTGRTVTEPTRRIPTYPVHLEGDKIVLELKHARRKAADADD